MEENRKLINIETLREGLRSFRDKMDTSSGGQREPYVITLDGEEGGSSPVPDEPQASSGPESYTCNLGNGTSVGGTIVDHFRDLKVGDIIVISKYDCTARVSQIIETDDGSGSPIREVIISLPASQKYIYLSDYWGSPEYTEKDYYEVATAETPGLMSAADKAKLDGLEAQPSSGKEPYTCTIISENNIGGTSASKHQARGTICDNFKDIGIGDSIRLKNTTLATALIEVIEVIDSSSSRTVVAYSPTNAKIYRFSASLPNSNSYVDLEYIDGIGLASDSGNGLMSAEDKTKLDAMTPRHWTVTVNSNINVSTSNAKVTRASVTFDNNGENAPVTSTVFFDEVKVGDIVTVALTAAASKLATKGNIDLLVSHRPENVFSNELILESYGLLKFTFAPYVNNGNNVAAYIQLTTHGLS